MQTDRSRLRHSKRLLVAIACSVTLFFFPVAILLWAQQSQQAQVFSVADIHGDFDAFVGIVRKAGVINAEHHWSAKNATLVQTGDILDRGPKPREAMDLLISLEKEAPLAGGHVVSLLGNHEVMNIMGDLRYVTPMNYASFADADSERRQKSAYQDYVKWRNTHSQLLAELPQPMEITEAEWMARHPVGFIEQREAFGPSGVYGKWLREHDAVAQIGGIIFLHGGIDPKLAQLKIEAVNSRIHEELKTFDVVKEYLQSEKVILPFFNLQEMVAVVQAQLSAERKSLVPKSQQRQTKMMEFLGFQEWLCVRPDGPLWFRGYDQWSEEEGVAQVGKLLDAYKATHIIVGHTVQRGGLIRPRFGDRVFLTDTGMLSSYYPGGKASLLEIRDGVKFTADYIEQQVVLFEPANTAAP